MKLSSAPRLFACCLMTLLASPLMGAAPAPLLMPLGPAWAANSVNVTIFRNDPITTQGRHQFAAYYDAEGRVVLASRELPQEQWKTTVTSLTGNVRDAHNGISMIIDDAGFLHVSWDHHGNPLNYARSKSPFSVELEKVAMSEKNEKNVSYPQFFRLPAGRLLFMFRDGASGSGNLVLNYYDPQAKKWTQLHENLISGEKKRNAYWQACVDSGGVTHVSWVWRESPDVASNHDICYARSRDHGKTWEKSDGTPYKIPITAATAEVAAPVPQKHELINQTSMCADANGRPIIATYYRPEGQQVVQYFVIHHDGTAWKQVQVSQRKTPFSLSGGGSKQIPISRPQVFEYARDGKQRAGILFRDQERGSKVSVAYCEDFPAGPWTVSDLTDFSVRFWEPFYDRLAWMQGRLNVYVQVAGQGDGETLEAIGPQTAHVLEWKP